MVIGEPGVRSQEAEFAGDLGEKSDVVMGGATGGLVADQVELIHDFPEGIMINDVGIGMN